MVQVQIPPGMKRATARTESRYAIQAIEARPDKPGAIGDGPVYLSATDGRILAIIESTALDRDPLPVQIPASILNGGKKAETVELVNGAWQARHSGRFVPVDPEAGAFPPCFDVLPEGDAETYSATVSLDADLLADLAAAICDPGEPRGVTLFIRPDKGKPVIVCAGSGRFGVLMPVSRNHDADRETYKADRFAYRVACNQEKPVASA